MNQQKVNVYHFFQVNEVLFYLINLFLFIGLSIYTVKDVTKYFVPLGIADILSLVILVILVALVIAGKLNRNTAMAIVLIISIFNFQISALVHSSAGGNISLQIAITTFISLIFASLAAFMVSKHMALGVGAVTLVFFIGMSLMYQDVRMIDDMVFYSVIIVGYSIVMYYYRNSLESLAQALYNSYQTVKKQKVELELLKEKAERINEANRPFVIFGRNTSGLVHDFKNDIGLLDSSRQLLRMKIQKGQTVDESDISELDQHISRLSDRVEIIKYVVSASQFRNDEDIPIKKLINAALYPFRLTNDLRSRIVFEGKVEGDPVIRASRYRLVQILENLVRNSCEAIVDHQDSQILDEDWESAPENGSIERLFQDQKRLGKVIVEGRQIGEVIFLAVQDNGPGISFCLDSDGEDCMKIAKFEIGKTTKSYGSGIGMVSVIESVEQLKGAMRILSGVSGTRIEIILPAHEQVRMLPSVMESLGFSPGTERDSR